MVDNFVDYLQNVDTDYNNLEYFGYIEDNVIVNIYLMRFVVVVVGTVKLVIVVVGIAVEFDDYLDNYYL
jgi:hypothetical protein